MRLQLPGRMANGEIRRGHAPTLLQRGPGGETFQAIPVVGAATAIRVATEVVGDGDVAHLRVDETVDHLPVHHGATADAAPDGQVDEVADIPGRPPAGFPEGGHVDVCVELDRNVQRATNRAREVEPPPGELGRRGHVAERGGRRIEVQGAERPDADRAGRDVPEEPDHVFERGLGLPGREGGDGDVVRRRTHGADELAATRLDAA